MTIIRCCDSSNCSINFVLISMSDWMSLISACSSVALSSDSVSDSLSVPSSWELRSWFSVSGRPGSDFDISNSRSRSSSRFAMLMRFEGFSVTSDEREKECKKKSRRRLIESETSIKLDKLSSVQLITLSLTFWVRRRKKAKLWKKKLRSGKFSWEIPPLLDLLSSVLFI